MTLLDVIAVVWAVAAIGILLVHLFSLWHYMLCVKRKGTYMDDHLALRQLLTLKKELQIKSRISIITYAGAESPMMLGFFRPILVLPDYEYSQEELYFIFKHELIHVKRHDIYMKLLLVIAGALHWFNPLVYFMQQAAVVDMELSCDERVVQGTAFSTRKAYTETLFSTLHKQYRRSSSLTTQFYGGNHIMKKRFENILSKSKKKNGVFVVVCSIGMVLFFGTLTGYSMEPRLSDTQAGHELPSAEAENLEMTQVKLPESVNNQSLEEPLSVDGQMVKRIAEEFAAAYFQGDIDRIREYLTNPYEWDMEVYAGSGIISEMALGGLTEIGEETLGSVCVVSLEYRDSDHKDMLLYLTLEFVKQKDGWSIQFYGTEA